MSILKKKKAFIRVMDRCQLLGGLIESLEIQYPLDSFTELMQRFQVIMFEMLNIVVRSANESHAIVILDFNTAYCCPSFETFIICNFLF